MKARCRVTSVDGMGTVTAEGQNMSCKTRILQVVSA